MQLHLSLSVPQAVPVMMYAGAIQETLNAACREGEEWLGGTPFHCDFCACPKPQTWGKG